MTLVRKVIHWLFWFSLAGYIFLSFWKPPLPELDSADKTILSQDPVQTALNKQPYTWKRGGQTYQINPLHGYEIRGLVVADYDSDDWLDFTHKQDPAQTKDLCLVWGENLKSGVYKQVKYRHGEFTCFVGWKKPPPVPFVHPQLSNNHLIPLNDTLARDIKNTHVGDQVYVKGWLVNYKILDQNGETISYRNTSTVREDHDCEIILVSEYRVLKQPTIPFTFIRQIMGWVALGSMLISLILFLFFPSHPVEYKYLSIYPPRRWRGR